MVTVHVQELPLLSDQVSCIIARGGEMHTGVSVGQALHITHALKLGMLGRQDWLIKQVKNKEVCS